MVVITTICKTNVKDIISLNLTNYLNDIFTLQNCNLMMYFSFIFHELISIMKRN